MTSTSAATSLFHLHLFNLLGQSCEDPAAGDVDGPDRQAQIPSRIGRAHALDCGPPEGLPCGRREVNPDPGSRQLEQLLLIILLPASFQLEIWVVPFLQAPVRSAATGADSLKGLALEKPG